MEADVARWVAAVDQARADVSNAEQGVSRARAEWTYANNNLHRIEPLLARQFVTVDQVDRARTSEIAQAQSLKQAQSQLNLAQAGLQAAIAQEGRSRAVLQQSKAQHEQAQHAVTTLEPLVNQRGARASAVRNARYNLDNCRVYAPFDARVTNLTISEGAYTHIGQQVFTLIDARTWWAVANFREGQLQHITPGMRADVYVLSKPNVRFSGVVESIGFGVTPDADVVGRLSSGLPDVQRNLNWVHLATRFPVRVRVENPPPELFRVSESSVVVIRGH
jgi:multidrug efflux system membrane fusion protein